VSLEDGPEKLLSFFNGLSTVEVEVRNALVAGEGPADPPL
jgi:predicted transcriptional regulator